MNYKNFIYLLLLIGLCTSRLYAATQINTPTVSGNWTIGGSPYYIHNNITIPLNSQLTIDPGVEVVFMGHYEINTQGVLSAIGTEKHKIIFRSNDTTGWSNLQSTAGAWKGITLENIGQTNFSQPTFEYCVFKDMKKYQSYGLIASAVPLLYINKCEFYHNHTDGILMHLHNNVAATPTKLKFTNCIVRDNITGVGMFTLYKDSVYVLNNKFYNNTATSGFGLFNHGSDNDMSNNFMLFDHNELYNNTTGALGGGVVNATIGGKVKVSNNFIHHNTMAKNGAIALQTKSSLVENNLVINNNQILEGIFCGINDGGAGIQLLGQNLDAAVPGRNIHIVRNNIVANNHSAITGAGIWVQHCEATVVNNTFINNTSKGLGAAVRTWGAYCKVRLYNNIIFGNKLVDMPNDTVYNNFSCASSLLELSNNLLDYHINPNNMPQNLQGQANNIYDHNLALLAPTTGAGVSYDATNANFSLTATTFNCLNRGNSNAPDHGTTDFYENPRVAGNSIDIGAVEFQGSGTRIKDTEEERQLQVFPSPSTGAISIKHQAGQAIDAISLMDLSGRLLHNFKISRGSEYTIQIGQYPDAVYLLGIQTGQQTIYKKIILKR